MQLVIDMEYFESFLAKPQWIQTMRDTALAIEERLHWECRANGKPKPSYNWLKNGQVLITEVNPTFPSISHELFVSLTERKALAH
jgi:hypothetical protein